MDRLFTKNSSVREVISLVAGLALYCILVYFLKIPCPIYFVTGISCPGCGMTRSLFSLLQFDLDKAMYYHPLILFCVFIFPAIAILHIKKRYAAKKILTVIFIVIFIATYLYRLFILKSPVLHFSPENGILVRLFNGLFN